MNDHDRYINEQRERLLRYLDPAVSTDELEQHPLEFVNQVEDEWFEHFSGQPLPMPSLAERAFWFALYLLEELEELRMLSACDPMIQYMEASLERVRPVLIAKEDIPEGFWATRPGEDQAFPPDDDPSSPDD